MGKIVYNGSFWPTITHDSISFIADATSALEASNVVRAVGVEMAIVKILPSTFIDIWETSKNEN